MNDPHPPAAASRSANPVATVTPVRSLSHSAAAAARSPGGTWRPTARTSRRSIPAFEARCRTATARASPRPRGSAALRASDGRGWWTANSTRGVMVRPVPAIRRRAASTASRPGPTASPIRMRAGAISSPPAVQFGRRRGPSGLPGSSPARVPSRWDRQDGPPVPPAWRYSPNGVRSRRLEGRFLGQPNCGLDEALEDLLVQGRGGVALGVPLEPDAEPVRVGRLDRLDHPVRGPGRDPQFLPELVHRLVVGAVHPLLAGAVDFFEEAPLLD